MRFSLGLPAGDHWADGSPVAGDDLTSIARLAEALGYDAVFLTDHPFPSAKWITDGGHSTLDPFVALSFVASSTTEIRMHTNLFIAPYRNPFLAAKMVSTLDFLSKGRVILGVGAGYLEAEFDAVGSDFQSRSRALDQAIEAMKLAWTGNEVDFQGDGFVARSNVMLPRPTQRPHPPIWVGGNSKAAIRRAVTLADGWCPMPSPAKSASYLRTPGIESLEDLAGRIAYASEFSRECGRSEPLDIAFNPIWGPMPAKAAPDAALALDNIAELTAMGVSWLTVTLPGGSLGELSDNVGSFASEVVAKTTSGQSR